MCAVQSTTTTSSIPKQVSSPSQSKPVPKWMKMKLQNKSSADKTAKPTAKKSSASAQKPKEGTRDEKRKRWAKKAKPIAKPPVRRGPVNEYISVCCSAPAQKPPCGTKVASLDPETGRPAKSDKTTGLGHFRCSQCRKACKVKPQAPKAKEAAPRAAVLTDGTIVDTVLVHKENPYLTPELKAAVEGISAKPTV
jgi:hypothetical protein